MPSPLETKLTRRFTMGALGAGDNLVDTVGSVVYARSGASAVTAFATPPIIGGAAGDFPGDSWFTAPNATDFRADTDGSFAVWLYGARGGFTDNTVAHKGAAFDGGDEFRFGVDGTNFKLIVSGAAGAEVGAVSISTSGTNFPLAAQWHLFVGRHDRANKALTLHIFSKDGTVNRISGAYTGTTVTTAKQATVGMRTLDATQRHNYLNVPASELLYFNSLITIEDVWALWNAGAGALPPYSHYAAAGDMLSPGSTSEGYVPLGTAILASSDFIAADAGNSANNTSRTSHTMLADGEVKEFSVVNTNLAFSGSAPPAAERDFDFIAPMDVEFAAINGSTATRLQAGGLNAVTLAYQQEARFLHTAGIGVVKGQSLVSKTIRKTASTVLPATHANSVGFFQTVPGVTEASLLDTNAANYTAGSPYEFGAMVLWGTTPEDKEGHAFSGDSTAALGAAQYMSMIADTNGKLLTLNLAVSGESAQSVGTTGGSGIGFAGRRLLSGRLRIFADCLGLNGIRGATDAGVVEIAGRKNHWKFNILHAGSRVQKLFLHTITPITENAPDNNVPIPSRTEARAALNSLIRNMTSVEMSGYVERNCLVKTWNGSAWLDVGTRPSSYAGDPVDVYIMDTGRVIEDGAVDSNTFQPAYQPTDGIHLDGLPGNAGNEAIRAAVQPQFDAAIAAPYPTVSVDTTQPTITSIFVDTNGTDMVIDTNEDCTGTGAGFDIVLVNGVDRVITSYSRLTPRRTRVILSSPVFSGQTVTTRYIVSGGDILDLAGNELEQNLNIAVTNNSEMNDVVQPGTPTNIIAGDVVFIADMGAIRTGVKFQFYDASGTLLGSPVTVGIVNVSNGIYITTEAIPATAVGIIWTCDTANIYFNEDLTERNIEQALTTGDVMRVLLSFMAGIKPVIDNENGTVTMHYRNLANTKDRIVGTQTIATSARTSIATVDGE